MLEIDETMLQRTAEVLDEKWHAKLSDTRIGHELALTVGKLAIAQRDSGKTEEAEHSFRRALDVWKQLRTIEPRDAEISNGVFVSWVFLGRLLVDARQYKNAVALFRSAVAEVGSLAGNKRDKENLAVILRELGEAQLKADMLEECRHTFRRCIRVSWQFLTTYPDHLDIASVILLAFDSLIHSLRGGDKALQRDQALRESARVSRQLHEKHPENAALAFDCAWRFWMLSRYDQAEALVDTVLRLAPTDRGAKELKSNILVERQKSWFSTFLSQQR